MRYGSIRYVNNLPVDLGLTTGAVASPAGLEVVHGTPRELNEALLGGTTHASAVSAAMLLDHPELRILPEATIASHGPVDSVLLVSTVPFDALDGRTVAVSEDSATGARLGRIILERDVGVRPVYRTAPSRLDHMLRAADAALLIGDDALRVSARMPDPDRTADGLHVLDLGEAWRAYTGLPMVYAVWVARPDAAPDAVDALRHALAASSEWGLAHMDAVLDEAHRRTGVSDLVLRTYYDRLTYTLGPREADGLRRFLDEAARLDARTVPTLEVPTAEVIT